MSGELRHAIHPDRGAARLLARLMRGCGVPGTERYVTRCGQMVARAEVVFSGNTRSVTCAVCRLHFQDDTADDEAPR
jgi:hypothetical protein